jgi:hypothetical protein
VTAENPAVRVVETEHGASTSPQYFCNRASETAVIRHVIEDEVTGDGIERPGINWQRSTEISDAVLNLASAILCPRLLDQPWRDVDAGDACPAAR